MPERIGYLELNSAGQIVSCCCNFAAMLGYARDELVNCSLLSLIHADSLVPRHYILQFCQGKRERLDIIERFLGKSGDVLWLRVSLVPIFGVGGQVLLRIGMFQVIDDCLPDQDLQKGGRVQTPWLVSDVQALVMVREKRILDCTTRFSQLSGFTIKDLIGSPVAGLLSPESRSLIDPFLVCDPHDAGEVELYLLNGRHVRARLLYMDSSTHSSLLAIRDVTAESSLERQKVREENAYRALKKCKTALANASSEADYLSDVCQLIFDTCDYQSVSILMSDSDKLRLRAQCGLKGTMATVFEDGWPPSDGSVSPLLRALNHGDTVYSPRLTGEIRLTPEQADLASLVGDLSMVIVPLLLDGRAIGLINFVCRDENGFSRHEIELLELAGLDISTGLQYLSTHTFKAVAEKTLARRESEMSALLDAIPAAVFVKDSRFQYSRVNDYFCGAFGMAREDLLGRTDHEILPADLASACEKSGNLAVASSEVIVCEEDYLQDGRQRSWLSSKRVIRNTDGAIIGLVGASLDITEQKQAGREKLKRLERQRDQVVNEIHHRIKNHLQGVVGLLRTKGKSNPVIEEVVDQVRSIAKVYGLQIRGADTSVGLFELVSSIHGHYQDVRQICSGEPHQHIYICKQEAVPIALIINELLANAVKHSNQSAVTRDVTLSLETEGDTCMVSITNRPATLPHGFDYASGAGVGEGLELVRSLLPASGSRLEFQEEAGAVTASLLLTPPILEFEENIE